MSAPNPYLNHPVGSYGWTLQQQLRSPMLTFDTNAYWNLLSPEEKAKLTQVLYDMKMPNFKFQKNKDKIRHIKNWTTGNDWMMIDGGEHDGKWVNPKYASEIFESGNIYDMRNETYIYFPIGNSLTDPLGIACHYETFCGGAQKDVFPNRWTPAASLRYHRRAYERKQRRKEKKKLQLHGLEDIAAEGNMTLSSLLKKTKT
jgi:hypothetical protein